MAIFNTNIIINTITLFDDDNEYIKSHQTGILILKQKERYNLFLLKYFGEEAEAEDIIINIKEPRDKYNRLKLGYNKTYNEILKLKIIKENQKSALKEERNRINAATKQLIFAKNKDEVSKKTLYYFDKSITFFTTRTNKYWLEYWDERIEKEEAKKRQQEYWEEYREEYSEEYWEEYSEEYWEEYSEIIEEIMEERNDLLRLNNNDDPNYEDW